MSVQAFTADLPAPDAFARTLSDRLPAFRHVEWLDRTGSTNTDLLARTRNAPTGDKPWLLGAHVQENGRGRAGRPWKSRPGATLVFSCAFDVYLPPAALPALSPLAGMAICEGLRGLAGAAAPDVCVKWPNDVLWRDGKLVGVLIESSRNAGGPEAGHTVIAGVGVNLLDAAELSQALQRQVADWSQIAEASGTVGVGPADVVCAVACALHDTFSQAASLLAGAFPARFARVDALAGRAVNVLDQGAVLNGGVAQGVDAQGRLLIATPTGTLPITVGEISIRPQA
ncbi:biotin--protein ligase [Bordetella ansorpii]|uniref:biotin--[biotin carboxyl-carrier protein] ligase n=1 Tax=Bordetella ansorpii TaxID=288768 RepID=A0A157R142_9BORD|nr:biotin--[acetyl-CoA-carboxylase] ligase [Bordetella ansorpii]SAI51722.1 biotin--protein ligase [Bordetella ansorpii]